MTLVAKTVLYALLLMLSCFCYGQEAMTKTPAVGVHLEMLNFRKTDTVNVTGKTASIGLAVSYQNNISSYFIYSTVLSGAFIKDVSKDDGKKDLFLDGSLLLRANCFRQDVKINPYAQAGLGFSKYKDIYNLTLPTGIGCQINLSSNIFLLINSQYCFALTNTRYNRWVNSIGIVGAINRRKVYKPRQVALPTISAPINRPVDTDGDGIIDTDDSCRLAVGIIKYHGCPPPDLDHDGIEDSVDKCPDSYGVAASSGCPEITSDLKQQINFTATKILFETGSFKLLQQSLNPLDDLVRILKDKPHLKLHIEGHTDNIGSANRNQLLSENRARTVYVYLTSAGINANRLLYQGYGQDRPVTDNSTVEGRRRNRRVELKIF